MALLSQPHRQDGEFVLDLEAHPPNLLGAIWLSLAYEVVRLRDYSGKCWGVREAA